jgi:hypothetical protein
VRNGTKFDCTAILSTSATEPVAFCEQGGELNFVHLIATHYYGVIATDLYPEGKIEPRAAEQCGR